MGTYRFTKTDSGADIRRPDGSIASIKSDVTILQIANRIELSGAGVSLPAIYGPDSIEYIGDEEPAPTLALIKLQLEAFFRATVGSGSSNSPAAGGLNFNSSVFIEAETAVDGTSYVEFESRACDALQVDNGTDVDIRVRKGGMSVSILVPSKTGRLFLGITDADQISIKRDDDATDQILIQAEALSR